MKIKIPNYSIIKKSINADKLGFIGPDNIIKFKTNEIAHKYAKNRVIKLISTHKLEHGILIKDNKILKEISGKENHLEIPKDITHMFQDNDFVHGHINITPLSIQDFIAQYQLGIKKVYAYNINGKFSALEKLPQKPLPKILPKSLQSKIYQVINKQNYNKIIKSFAKTYADTVYPEKYNEYFYYYIRALFDGLSKLSKIKFDKIARHIDGDDALKMEKIGNDATKSGIIAKLTHTFWLNNPSKNAYKYTTDLKLKDYQKS